MRSNFLILSFICVLAVFHFGCNSANKKPQELGDIKAAELINRQEIEPTDSFITNLGVSTLRVNIENLAAIQELMLRENGTTVQHADTASFLSNGLLSYAGNQTNWQKISKLLVPPDAIPTKRTSLLAVKEMDNDVDILTTTLPVSLYYYSNGAKAGIGFDAGQVFLRMKTEPLIGLRQICKVYITPVYKTDIRQESKKAIFDKSNYEFVFASAALNLRLRPGEFLLLAPTGTGISPFAKTLGDVIFYPEKSGNTVILYLIVCNQISEKN